VAINLEGSTRPEIKLQITIQGRRLPCTICEDDTHWPSQCPLKKTGGKQSEKGAEPFPTLESRPAAPASLERTETEEAIRGNREDPPHVARDISNNNEVSGDPSSGWSVPTSKKKKLTTRNEVGRALLQRSPDSRHAVKRTKQNRPVNSDRKEDQFCVSTIPLDRDPLSLWTDSFSPQSGDLYIALPEYDTDQQEQMNN
jgi:hypothetical protein